VTGHATAREIREPEETNKAHHFFELVSQI
jgi:hypothetical protein